MGGSAPTLSSDLIHTADTRAAMAAPAEERFATDMLRELG